MSKLKDLRVKVQSSTNYVSLLQDPQASSDTTYILNEQFTNNLLTIYEQIISLQLKACSRAAC